MTKIAFMFPGQGSFDPGMGREIAEAEPAASISGCRVAGRAGSRIPTGT